MAEEVRTGKATKIRDVETMKAAIFQALYRVDPPVVYDEDKETDHVIVSASVVPVSGPETYIFPADSEGNILDWAELEGSFRGDLDHTRALIGAGYVIDG
jgi:hypothetical protein